MAAPASRSGSSRPPTSASQSVRHRFRGQALGGFDAQVVKDLEFDVIRAWLAGHAQCPTAQARAAQLVPSRDPQTVRIQLETAWEFTRIRQEGHAFPGITFEELDREIQLLGIRDSVLEEAGFMRILQASRLVNEVLRALHAKQATFPRMARMLQQPELVESEELIRPIEAVFDAKGEVRTEASPLLGKIRGEMVQVRRNHARAFQRALKECGDRGFLADIRESVVNDRRALAIAATHKRKVEGLILGQSKNGSIAFIEPAATVPLNNELELLRDDERREIRRILLDLTRNIRRFLPWIQAYQRLLTELDWLQAKSRLASELHATLPGIRNQPGFHLIEAYHPLLRRQNESLGRRTEPQTLELSRRQRMLVISGPNAGGKSISLKTVGLLQLMWQSGLLIPVQSGSEVGIFDAVLTDIGDNQSIENQLSTYSYRLKRMKAFLEVSGPATLLLLDEFGTGSDPELGGALAEVFFEELYDRGGFGVITTHYANIKTRAAELPEALNGSMRFDRESLEPRYRLDIGQPGSSFTFEVAETNGIPAGLISRAKAKLDPRKVQLDELLSDLQREKARSAKVTDRNLKRELELEQTLARLASEKKGLESKVQTQQEIAQEQNLALVRGRKMQQFIDQYKESGDNKALFETVRKYLAVERTREQEALALAKARSAQGAAAAAKRRPKHHVERIQVGSLVRLRTGKERGEVLEIAKEVATVRFGSFRMKVELNKLSWLAH